MGRSDGAFLAGLTMNPLLDLPWYLGRTLFRVQEMGGVDIAEGSETFNGKTLNKIAFAWN